MKKELFDVVLLLALPASGKSEVRTFMANVEPERLKKEFHIGENVQLDDFPYVHMMRRIDEELLSLGEKRIYYPGQEPFYDGRDWGTLTELLNEDYQDLINKPSINVDSAAQWLFDRFENASKKIGIEPRLGKLSKDTMDSLKNKLEKECRDLLNEKIAGIPDTLDGKTIVIEFARGGSDGSSLPLTGTFGYQYTLPILDSDLLSKASILYIWVTPEESRRKNNERNDPNDPGSILNHGVPMAVMLGDYGVDDMPYLLETSEVKNTITVKKGNEIFHLPIGVFDNRVDRTSFLRTDKNTWPEDKIKAVTEGIKQATDNMYENY